VRLFVSLFAYAFGKQHWPNVEAAAARERELGEQSSVPGFRTLHRLRKFVDELELHTDHSTLIARARDRAAGRFLRSECDQWIAIDDDVDADDRACVAMLTTKPRDVLSALMRVRSGERELNFVPLEPSETTSLAPRTPVRVLRSGMGMIRIPRVPLANMAAGRPDLQWDEPNPDAEKYNAETRRSFAEGRVLESALRGVAMGVCTSPGLFLPQIKRREWLDDDYTFCERAREAGVEIWGVVLPGVTHAGIPTIATRPPESRL
jgi:hypothetical protein